MVQDNVYNYFWWIARGKRRPTGPGGGASRGPMSQPCGYHRSHVMHKYTRWLCFLLELYFGRLRAVYQEETEPHRARLRRMQRRWYTDIWHWPGILCTHVSRGIVLIELKQTV